MDVSSMRRVIEHLLMVPDLAVVSSQHSSQERSGNSLSAAEKIDRLAESLEASPAIFLDRYGRHLPLALVSIFGVYEDDEILDRVTALLRAGDVKAQAARRRNRRLRYLEVLLSEGTYFSEEAMAERDPLLFEEYVQYLFFSSPIFILTALKGSSKQLHEYVGQHRTEAEIQEQSVLAGKQSWSSQLMEVIANNDLSQRRELSRTRQRDQAEEEFDTDDDDIASDDDNSPPENRQGSPCPTVDTAEKSGSGGVGGIQKSESLSLEERHRLRGEFERLMRERFLAGGDASFFDYKICDEDSGLDDIAIRDNDAEEAYFDDDAGYQPVVEIAADPQRVQSQSADANAKDACDSMRE